MDFALGLVNSVFNLSDGQVMFFLRNLNNRRTVKSILLVKKFLGLVEMTSGLVNASFRLKNQFLCTLDLHVSSLVTFSKRGINVVAPKPGWRGSLGQFCWVFSAGLPREPYPTIDSVISGQL